ncbi:MAG: hypothetical protein JWN99_1046 [Ilumatobacteraceae bacterium]|nr:hypothetical protein [Ilumatobacteraceae bacterium]
MINTLRSEWIKLRTVRMNYVLVILAVGFPLIVVVLTAALVDVHDMSTEDLVNTVSGTSVITALLLGVIGATSITSEFGFGTIRPTFAATPQRSRVLVVKAVLSVVVALIVEAIVAVLCYGIGSALLNNRNGDISLASLDHGRSALIGVVLFAAIVSLLGYGLGLLTRSSPVSVAVLVIWPLVAEPLIAGLLTVAGLDHALRWMPFQGGFALFHLSGSDPDQLGRAAGGLYFLAVSAVIATVGVVVANNRDA